MMVREAGKLKAVLLLPAVWTFRLVDVMCHCDKKMFLYYIFCRPRKKKIYPVAQILAKKIKKKLYKSYESLKFNRFSKYITNLYQINTNYIQF